MKQSEIPDSAQSPSEEEEEEEEEESEDSESDSGSGMRKSDYFLIHQFNDMFWVLNENRLIEYPQHMLWLRNREVKEDCYGSFEYPQHIFWLRNSAVEEGRRREVKQSEIPDSAQSPSEEKEEETED